MKWFDLSHSIVDAMPVYPGDARPRLELEKDLPSDGYVTYQLHCGMHVGTHVDAPQHLLKGGKGINELPVEHFMGKAVVLDVRGQAIIGYQPDYSEKIAAGDIVLFFTGWERYYGEELYYLEHPVIDRKIAEFLVERRVKLIGLDTPSPDRPPFEIHKLLLANDIFIVENLTRLDRFIGTEFVQFMALPLNIHAEASLVRAVAGVSIQSRMK